MAFSWSSVVPEMPSVMCRDDAVWLESDFAGKSLKSRRLFLNSGSESRELASEADLRLFQSWNA